MSPEDLSGFQVCTGELSSNSEGIDFFVGNGWCGFGAEVAVKAVGVITVLLNFPKGISSFGIEGLKDFVVAGSVVENDFSLCDNRAAVAIADFDFPECWILFGLGRNANLGGVRCNAVAIRAKELWPVGIQVAG